MATSTLSDLIPASLMHTIPFQEKIEGKNQAAFVIFYALDGQPWLHYIENDDRKANRRTLTVPTCLCMNRCDGMVGFIGGRVENGETLEEAAKREVYEEIGVTILQPLEPIVAHDIGWITTHAFAVELPYAELRQIQHQASAAEHFGSEVTGLFLAHLIDYSAVLGKGGGIMHLLQNALATSVREELCHFLLKKELFTQEQLTKLTAQAGFQLETLLR